MDVTNFDQAEIVEPTDLTAISGNARDAFDRRDKSALGWPAHWASLTVSQSTSDTISVSSGEYYEGNAVYASREAIEVDLQSFKPRIATDERWMALILRGETETINATRSFETGEEPLVESVPVNQSTPKTIRRKMTIIPQSGNISPAPAVQPTINEDDCCIAFVLLKSTGIVDIVANESARVKSVYEIEGRVTALEIRVDTLFQNTEAIATDVASIAAQIETLPDRRLIDQLTNDVGRTRQILNFPEAARNYFFDQALVPDFWDLDHAQSIARIQEGVRFAYAAQQIKQLQLLRPNDPDIVLVDNKYLMPAFDETMRLESPKGTGRQDISNTVHTVRTAHTGRRSTTSIRYGATVKVCENTAGWNAADLAARRAGEIFKVSGKDYVSLGKTDNPWNQTETARNGHSQYAVQNVIRDTVTSTYTYYTTEQFGLNGAIYAQTFLNAQMMVLTSIDLFFTRIGSTGDVRLCVCEINSDGTPNYDEIISEANLTPGDLQVNAWNKFTLTPALLEPGKRYAWFTVTTGNHQIAMNSGNTFTGGTKFVCTDGVWSQGSTTDDFSFRLFGAKFRKSRVEVEMSALDLANGMTEIQLVYEGWEPAGTARPWEISLPGQDTWIPIDARDPNPLSVRPEQLKLRLVLIGTQDVAPMIVMDQYATSLAARCRGDMTAISEQLALGFSTNTFQLVMNVDAFDPVHHNYDPKLIVGGATVLPSAVVMTQDPTKPSRYEFIADFSLGSATTSAALRIEATTDDVALQPFIQDVQLNAY